MIGPFFMLFFQMLCLAIYIESGELFFFWISFFYFGILIDIWISERKEKQELFK